MLCGASEKTYVDTLRNRIEVLREIQRIQGKETLAIQALLHETEEMIHAEEDMQEGFCIEDPDQYESGRSAYQAAEQRFQEIADDLQQLTPETDAYTFCQVILSVNGIEQMCFFSEKMQLESIKESAEFQAFRENVSTPQQLNDTVQVTLRTCSYGQGFATTPVSYTHLVITFFGTVILAIFSDVYLPDFAVFLEKDHFSLYGEKIQINGCEDLWQYAKKSAKTSETSAVKWLWLTYRACLLYTSRCV